MGGPGGVSAAARPDVLRDAVRGAGKVSPRRAAPLPRARGECACRVGEARVRRTGGGGRECASRVGRGPARRDARNVGDWVSPGGE